MKKILFAAGIPLVFLSAQNVQAALTEISFTGEVTGTHNRLGTLWDAEAVLGQEITGRFLLDAAAAGSGREETDYFWWWNISSDEVMSSAVRFAGHHYRLRNLNRHNKRTDSGWDTSEFIPLEDGPTLVNEDEIPVPDSLGLKDRSSLSTTDDQGSHTDPTQVVEVRVEDHVNDFLRPPPPDQAFIWQDSDPDDSSQKGIGSLGHQQDESSFDPASQTNPFEPILDSDIVFRLTEVVSKPARIVEPGSTGLLMLGLIGLHWLRRRRV